MDIHLLSERQEQPQGVSYQLTEVKAQATSSQIIIRARASL